MNGAIAFLLLLVFSPLELPCPSRAPESCWTALKEVAWQLELSGPSCTWTMNFRDEVRWVRNNYRNCKELPSICDCYNFPTYDQSYKVVNFCNNRLEWLDRRSFIYLWRSDDYRDLICQGNRIRRIWDINLDAQNPHQFWTARRRVLQRLKEEIGESAYWEGRLPDPIW